MKRAMFAIGLAAAYCWWRERHALKRQAIGGQRCMDCKRAFADMDEAGEDAQLRETRFYDRRHGLTRKQGWQDELENVRSAGW